MDKSNLRIEMLKRFLAEDPEDDFSEYALALELQGKGHRKDAIYHLEHLLNRNEEYLAAYYQCGKLYETENDFAKAADRYEKGIQVAKKQNNIKTLNELKTALEMMG